MEIQQIAILQDNYAHLLIDRGSGVVAVVDPAEPGKVIPEIESLGLILTHIFCTHHHWDHAGGNAEMLVRFPDATVVASAEDAAKMEGATLLVKEGDRVKFGDREIHVLGVPCHTRGHVAYLADGNLFCGDTLFVAGCGRFFEGDAREMDRALNDVFGSLDPATRVYCGHEYTVSNLRFAQHIEPDNLAVQEKRLWAEAAREKNASTVPSILGEEFLYNPFMRVRRPELQRLLGVGDAIEAMKVLREKKNGFRG